MITILNRKELMTLSSAEELARMKEALKAKGIAFEVKALRSRSAGAGRSASGTPAATSWPKLSVGADAYRQISPGFDAEMDPSNLLYRLYVYRKDYDAAYAAVHQAPAQ